MSKDKYNLTITIDYLGTQVEVSLKNCLVDISNKLVIGPLVTDILNQLKEREDNE